MKKFKKISKIFLAVITIFSQLSTITSVLAYEIAVKPLTIDIARTDSNENLIIDQNDKFEVKYKTSDSSCDSDKEYTVRFSSKFVYLDTTEENANNVEINVNGSSLIGEVVNSYKLDPISTIYNGNFVVVVGIYDGERKLYEGTNSINVTDYFKGLTGSLNNWEVLPTSETIGLNSTGRYLVSEGKEYTQNLNLMTGELSPNSKYKIVLPDGTKTEAMTGTEISSYVFNGTTTDLTNELYGETATADSVTVILLGEDGEETLHTYNYEYVRTIKYGTRDNLPIMMETYLTGSTNPAMDLVDDEIIDFKDIMEFNNRLEELDSTIPTDNTNLSVAFGEVRDNIVEGDIFELNVILSSDNLVDYIDGIDALVTTNEKLKLVNVSFNDKLIGRYNADNKIVAAGKKISKEEIVMTLKFEALSEGNGSISLTGNTAKYLNIKEFTELTKLVDIARKPSDDNNLSSLKSNVGIFDKAFDSNETIYNLIVPYDTEKVTLSGALNNIHAIVEGFTEYILTDDKTVANIIVTAENGSEKVYTVYIQREAKPYVAPIGYTFSTNNYLKLLEINGYEIVFDKKTNEYKITVGSDILSLDIKAIAEDIKSKVEIRGNESFAEGENVVTITVTAENNSTNEYKIVVDKEAADKTLLTEIDEDSNTGEKVVIIILIILVVFGLLYLIFKKDEENVPEIKKSKDKKEANSNTSKKNEGTLNKKNAPKKKK